MTKFTGIILFVGCVLGFGFSIYGIFYSYARWVDYGHDSDLNFIPVILVILLSFLAGIYYSIATKFWLSKRSVLDDLERENQIIRKQIEKRELLTKLDNLEKDGSVSRL